jgi:hypothetical protein
MKTASNGDGDDLDVVDNGRKRGDVEGPGNRCCCALFVTGFTPSLNVSFFHSLTAHILTISMDEHDHDNDNDLVTTALPLHLTTVSSGLPPRIS